MVSPGIGTVCSQVAGLSLVGGAGCKGSDDGILLACDGPFCDGL